MSQSCGCIRGEKAKSRAIHGHNTKLNRTKEHMAWAAMITRCYYPKYNEYESYGGRGITVCKEWRESFVAFLSDMGMCPEKSMSLDRIDNDKNYNKSNCRWATRAEQARNKNTNVWAKKASYLYPASRQTMATNNTIRIRSREKPSWKTSHPNRETKATIG
jgi:hypothetical protein